MGSLEQYGATTREYADLPKNGKFQLARVIAQDKRRYGLMTDDGERRGEVTGAFRFHASGPDDYPAVGDFVAGTVVQHSGNFAIHSILPRRTVFKRVIPGKTSRIQVIAANLDIVFICMSLNANYNANRLERYLSVAWESGAKPVVVLTKSDLLADTAGILAEVNGIAGGAPVVLTTSQDPASCLVLRGYLKYGMTGAFIGSSGVGKSTLVNILMGSERQLTQDIRERDDKGRHTTSRREMMLLPQGGVVIDTPGMRELEVDNADLQSSFEDIEELALQCRFTDCRHVTEPGCAVRRAIEAGQLDERRLESYLKLRRELDL